MGRYYPWRQLLTLLLNMRSNPALTFGLMAALTWAQSGPAEVKEPPPPTPPRFELTTRLLEIPERGIVTNLVLCTASQAFSFLPPTGWEIGVDEGENKIKWQSPDFRRALSIRIIPSLTGRKPLLKIEGLRQAVLQRFPGAVVTDEFICYTSGESGAAFDLRYAVRETFNLSTRVAFVAFPGGEVEFNLTTPTEDFAQNVLTFGNFLNSFKIEPLPHKD